MMGNLIDFIIKRTSWTPRIARYAAMALVGLVIAALVWAVIAIPSCLNGRQRAAQGRLDTEQSSAQTNSAADAINATGAVAGRSVASEDLSRSNAEDIRNAEGANDKVNPAVRDAGIASLCKRAVYRDSPRCKLRQPSPN